MSAYAFTVQPSTAVLALWLSSVLYVALMISFGPAHAQDEEPRAVAARSLFYEGLELAKAGALQEARERFVASAAQAVTPPTLLNLAAVDARLGDFQASLATLARCETLLSGAPEARYSLRVQEMRAEIARLSAALIVESTPVEAKLRVDGEPLSSASPVRIQLRPGAHRIELTSEGFAPLRQELTLDAGEERLLKLDLVSLGPPEVSSALTRQVPHAAERADVSVLQTLKQVPPSSTRRGHDDVVRTRRRRTVAISVGLAALGGILATVLLVRSRARSSDPGERDFVVLEP